MKLKWYLSTFIIILSFLGVSLEQYSTPNQEIVVQFNNSEVSLFETQNTIAIVKKQLQDFGVDNIKVHEAANGTLKITYHSDVDVAAIKELFSSKKNLDFGITSHNSKEPSNLPSSDNSNEYQLDVSEIQKSNETDSDFNGIVVDVSQKSERFFKPAVKSINSFEVKEENSIEKVAYIIQKKVAIAIDHSTHNIPEVRAGPRVYKNS
jgi:preprotein translocase subunit SecD